MAFTPNNFLYSPSNVTLKDYQHAARVFSDDQFRLAPKHKFLFHVAFNINPSALKNIDLVERYKNEINVLVKAVDLPQYKVTTESLNQYNRKKVVQTTHKYDPVSITFHDDNMGLINQLWQNYYSYYYATPSTSSLPGSYRRTAMKNEIANNFRYGLDNNSSVPFFDSIIIYQMARQEFVSYTLVNPIIKSWTFDQADYGQGGPTECTMQVDYEGLYFGNGAVQPGNPVGFALQHYDRTPSPLGAGKARGITGLANVLGGIGTVFGDIASGRFKESPLDFLATAVTAVNTYNNAKAITKEGLKLEGRQIVNSTVTQVFNNAADEIVQRRTGGLNNIVVPRANSTQTNTTPANPINIP